MIPKIIHYCWFGGKEMPKLAKKCLKSWDKYCPDYKIMCWNEQNFDINSNQYVKEAYENKKFAFVTDYVRLYALYNYGGVYMDTDVEVIKRIDDFLSCNAFIGFENDKQLQTGIMATEKESLIIKEVLKRYENKKFVKEDGTLDLTANPQIITEVFDEKGLIKNNTCQKISDWNIYPIEYFCAIDYITKQKKVTDNTATIHWYSGSWLPFNEKIKLKVYSILGKTIGEKRTKEAIEKSKKIIKN